MTEGGLKNKSYSWPFAFIPRGKLTLRTREWAVTFRHWIQNCLMNPSLRNHEDSIRSEDERPEQTVYLGRQEERVTKD